MKKTVVLLCVLALLLTGCGVAQKMLNEGETLSLYYPAALADAGGGDAIDSVSIPRSNLPQEDVQAQAEAVLALLMGEYEEKPFESPIPRGTTLLSCEVKGSTAYVDFSSAYGQLSGMDLTLADYCVTLSLTQLTGIYAVHITVAGQELAYRDTNLFMASDVLLSATENVVRTLAVSLYFPDADGNLTAEERLLSLYEGETRVDVIVSALLAGPENEELQPLVPEGFTVLSARAEDGICYLNLTQSAVELLGDEKTEIFRGFTDSLCELDDVNEVWFFTDGEYQSSMTP